MDSAVSQSEARHLHVMNKSQNPAVPPRPPPPPHSVKQEHQSILFTKTTHRTFISTIEQRRINEKNDAMTHLTIKCIGLHTDTVHNTAAAYTVTTVLQHCLCITIITMTYSI